MDKQDWKADKKFQEASWQEMSKILDKEMPDQKKKNRVIWIWLVGLCVFSALVFGILSYLGTPKSTVDDQKLIVKEDQLQTTQDNDIVELDQSNTIKPSLELVSSESKISELKAEHKETQSELNSDISNQNIEYSTANQTRRKETSADIAPTVSLATSINSNVLLANKETNDQLVISDDQSNTVNNSKGINSTDDIISKLDENLGATKQYDQPVLIAEQTPNLEKIASISSLLSIKETVLKISLYHPQIKNFESPSFTRKLSYIIGAHAVATTDQNFYGYGGHIGLDYTLTPNVSIRTMFARQSLKSQSDPTLALSDVETAGTPLYDFSKINIEEIAKYDEQNHLYNLTISYRIVNQFSVFAGYQYRHTLGKRQSVFSDGEDSNLLNTEADVFTNENQNQSVSSSNSVFLRNTKIYNPIVGFRYQLRHFDSSISYEYGTKTNYTNLISSESSKPRSFLQLNLSARF